MKILLPIAIFCLSILSSYAQPAKDTDEQLVWHSDIMKAQEVSKTTRKPIFAFFTGSDWCGWCHKLQKDVFSKPEFIEWANKNVILLELDFPRRKQLPPEIAQQNFGLQQVFKVSGYPTIWMFFLDKDDESKKFTISALGSLGYPQGFETGKEQVKFLSDANQILSNYTSK